MGTPEQPGELDLSHVESINNLDTARMALRWALERLRALEKTVEELSEKSRHATEKKTQAEQEQADLKRLLDLRSQENSERERYFAKVETYLTQQLAGKLDLPELLKREVQVEELEELLNGRQVRLEKDAEARRAALEQEYRRLKTESETQALLIVERGQAAAVEYRKNLEREFAIKLAEMADQEVRLKAEENALAQRQAAFTQFCREQRLQLERDIKSYHESMEDQTKFCMQSAERYTNRRHDAVETAWQQEKGALIKEVAEWQHRAQEYLPQLFAAQKRLALLEEALQQARCETQSKLLGLESRLKAAQQECEALRAELDRARQKAGQDLPQMLTLEKRLAEAESSRQRLDFELAQERDRCRSLEKETSEKESSCRERLEKLAVEKRRLIEDSAGRMSDMDQLQSLLLARYHDMEAEIHGRDLAWKNREEFLRKRDQDWHKRMCEWQIQLTGKSQQLEALKARLLETIQTYRTKMSGHDPRQPS